MHCAARRAPPWAAPSIRAATPKGQLDRYHSVLLLNSPTILFALYTLPHHQSLIMSAAAYPAGGTLVQTFKRSFTDVPVDASNAVSTTEFLEAAEALTTMFGMFLPRDPVPSLASSNVIIQMFSAPLPFLPSRRTSSPTLRFVLPPNPTSFETRPLTDPSPSIEAPHPAGGCPRRVRYRPGPGPKRAQGQEAHCYRGWCLACAVGPRKPLFRSQLC